jgi:Sec-independent protein secretion pathway component TatC
LILYEVSIFISKFTYRRIEKEMKKTSSDKWN